jgi:hypothetical protein
MLNATNGQERSSPRLEASIGGIAWNGDRSRLALSFYGRVNIVTVGSFKIDTINVTSNVPNTPIALTGDGSVLAVAEGQNVRFVDVLKSKTMAGPPLVNESEVNSVRFSPDGHYLIVGTKAGYDVWDVGSREKIAGPWDLGSVSSIQFTPDGKRLLVVGAPPLTTRSPDPTARVFFSDFFIPGRDHPLELAQLAEAVLGERLDDGDKTVAVSDAGAVLDRLRFEFRTEALGTNTVASFIRWFLSDPCTRTLSPYSKVNAQEALKKGSAVDSSLKSTCMSKQ